jgi:hypothetical protein
LSIEEECRDFPGPEKKELGDEGEEKQKGWPAEKRKEQGMKSSLANLSVAIRILIRLLILTFFRKEGSSSDTCFLEALFGVGILGDPIVGRVLAAFCSGVANPLLG